jgi:uncharacterized protein
MTIKKFGLYIARSVDPITEDLDWWHPVEGAPTMQTWIEHQSGDGKFLTGYWEATPGSYRGKYEVDEFIRMFEGRAILTDRARSNALPPTGIHDSRTIPVRQAQLSGTRPHAVI